MMSNTSIKQLNAEVVTAKTQALREPHRFERTDEGLSDMITSRPKQSGKQTIDPFLKAKIESLFEKFPDQYTILGLYHAAGFTLDEIADMRDDSKGNVRVTLKRAEQRLKKYLTEVEYDSIRWTIGDLISIAATPTPVETLERISRHREFTADQPCYTVGDSDPALDPIWKPLNLHPPEKFLPVPRGVLLDEAAL